MIKPWVTPYLPTQEEFKNLCFLVVVLRIRELWAFVYVMSKRSYVINFLHWFCLCVVKKGGRRKNLLCNGLSYSWQTQWYKLQLCTALRL